MEPRIKRLLSMLLVFAMVFSLTVPAAAASGETVQIAVGESATLKSYQWFATTTWTSSDETVATVTDGTVTGVAEGTAVITAISESYFSFIGTQTTTYTVVVTGAQEDPGLTVEVGQTLQLEVDANGGTTTWTSSDDTIATVDGDGLVTGVAEGDVTITAKTTKTSGGFLGFFWWGGSKATTTTEFDVTVVAGDGQPTESTETEPEPTETEPVVVTYTVTFDSNGGSAVDAQAVEEGMTATEPDAPSMEGYTFTGWYVDAELTTAYDFATPVTADVTLYAKWEEENENYCTVDYVLVLDESVIDNADKFHSIRIAKGSAISAPDNPISSYAIFEGWFTGLDAEVPFDFNVAITESTSIFAKWTLDTTDTDGDGIYDSVEADLGTDSENADSDNDGLNDYIEKVIGTDPNMVDTDGDTISDYDEDADTDNLSNGYEIEVGTKPEYYDSDHDGINDYDEINTYMTNPLSSDTDSDGANDLWEINNGFDPLVADSSFEVSMSSEEVTEYNLISASVTIDIPGEQTETLNVQRVEFADNPLVRPTLPGYMSAAYDFTLDGSFSEATITFNYNIDVYGAPDEDFQPRIYYLNEELGCYEELDGQVVVEGSVSVTVTHFSTYILLNKVEFDKVWEEEIRPPTEGSTSESTGLDMMLLIDCSGSMGPQGANNDPENIRLEVAKQLVEKTGESDRVAVISFGEYITLLTDFTNDKEVIYSAIDSVGNTDNYTYINKALSKGFEVFDSSEREDSVKYMILLTDGKSSDTVSNYADNASARNITIFTVGLGSNLDEDLLRDIATSTGGKYYHASVADDLYDIFDVIEDETIDYTTDSNDDGISDYYTQLIYEGKMPMADHLTGIDLSSSADYDGDGLKNGEEIEVITNGNRVYLKITSNPAMKHSDRDGIDDYAEVQNGTNPLKYTVEQAPVDYLTEDYNFYAPDVSDSYHEEWFGKFITDANALIHVVWNKPEIYRDIMVDYFVNYSKEDYLDDISFEATRTTMLNTLTTILGWFEPLKENGADYYDCFNKVIELIDLINGTTNKADLYLIYEQYEVIVEQIAVLFPDNTVLVQTRAVASAKVVSVNISKLGKNVSKVCDGISYAVSALDLIDTIESFSAVSANNMAFEQNLDILQDIIDHSVDEYARSAAQDIKNQLEKDYTEEVKAVVADVAENAIPLIADKIMMSNPYTAAVVVVRNAIALITGINVDLKQQFQMYSYTELARATSRLFGNEVNENGYYYEAKTQGTDVDAMLKRYLTHIAQMRILGEKMFCDWQEDDGVIGWFTDNSDVEEIVDGVINSIIAKANALELNLVPSLYQ